MGDCPSYINRNLAGPQKPSFSRLNQKGGLRCQVPTAGPCLCHTSLPSSSPYQCHVKRRRLPGAPDIFYPGVRKMERTPMLHWLGESHMLSLDPVTLSGECNAPIGLLRHRGPSAAAEAERQRTRESLGDEEKTECFVLSGKVQMPAMKARQSPRLFPNTSSCPLFYRTVF